MKSAEALARAQAISRRKWANPREVTRAWYISRGVSTHVQDRKRIQNLLQALRGIRTPDSL